MTNIPSSLFCTTAEYDEKTWQTKAPEAQSAGIRDVGSIFA
jgi:hypothetical protein